MSTEAVLRELLVRQLDHWLPGALHRSRRATLALAYAGSDTGGAEAALRVVAEFADRLRGRRLTVLVLAEGGAELPARLGAAETALPADVAVHVVPGHPDRLPVALQAAGAAGAPLLAVVDGGDPDPALLAAVATGRPAELLLVTAAGRPVRPALTAAGFPLATEVELVPVGGGPARLLGYATASDKGLEALKDALWAVDEYAGVRYRDPADPAGRLLDISLDPDPGPLRRELLAELARSGPRTVTELRRFAATSTVYRAADANRALASLLASGAVTRSPEHGRLGGDVLVTLAPGGDAGSSA
ncbi:hypothetical protein G3554_03055 [Micromonospora sp. PPF5-17]|uniref:Uncharacterized protein n=1 Tax=Micromonospora solifontis TaxID=2487138 RepID=A0ABX9WNB0_9ACTN|nr:hypothetical protein [Micromonospora solifontis]NES35153.1 hypothetical protein [Micromonospora solifontis]RNM01136.1 hypothetical protein EFE23_03070 [Micromonospora solifontis]